jgi:hypothetical protein
MDRRIGCICRIGSIGPAFGRCEPPRRFALSACRPVRQTGAAFAPAVDAIEGARL